MAINHHPSVFIYHLGAPAALNRPIVLHAIARWS
jgi:hypothetical protein